MGQKRCPTGGDRKSKWGNGLQGSGRSARKGTGDSRGQKKGRGGGGRREDRRPWHSSTGDWGVVGDSRDQKGGNGVGGRGGRRGDSEGQIERTGKGGGI